MFPVENTLLDYNFQFADPRSVMVRSKSANRWPLFLAQPGKSGSDYPLRISR